MHIPDYGSITTRYEDNEGNASVVRDGYHGKLPRTRRVWLEESKIVEGKEQLFLELLPKFDAFLSGNAKELDIEIRHTSSNATRVVFRTLEE